MKENLSILDVSFSIITDDTQRNELADFYSTYRNWLCNIAHLKLNNCFEAEDAVQTVFAEIADNPEVFEMVQQEFERRKDGNSRYSGVDIFSSKIRCGCCGLLDYLTVYKKDDIRFTFKDRTEIKAQIFKSIALAREVKKRQISL